MWPGSTMSSRRSAGFAFKNRFIRRSKYIAKSRSDALMRPISKRSYGKAITAKLTYVTSGSIGALTDWSNVYGLVSLMQSSPDWNNYKESYALMNLLNITVKILPQPYLFEAGVDHVAAICYDTKDAGAMASLASCCGHLQHKLMNFSINAPNEYIFKTKTRATHSVPQSTANNDESWGYIKVFADNTDFNPPANKSICKLEFTITVAFSAEQ